ncbi:MAG: J domain-containing protein [Treponema sp.]|nr:J domain-containing protein [Treponema sp.]
MENHYKLLGVKPGASTAEIKKAFREKAKKLHPDITGSQNAEAMQRLIKAYEALSDLEHRFRYDKAYEAYANRKNFDYRTWLKEKGDPSSMAKLIFYELLHLEEDRAIEIWRENGGLAFNFNKHMDREDWMDCQYILAEELDKKGFSFEAFKLMTALLDEEMRRPYFRLFTPEIKLYLKALVKTRLRSQVDDETWIDCMESMMGIGFTKRDEAVYKESIEKTLRKTEVPA